MNNVAKMRSFIVLRLFGLILLSLGAGLVTILLVFNGSGPSLSNISTEENFNEIMIYGSYTYGFFIDFFNYSSFLLTIFFLASGFKIFFNFGKRNFIIQFLFFLVGFSLYNFSAQYFGLNNAKFGELLLVSVGTMLENFFSNYYLITLIYIVFLMLSLFLIFYSITYSFSLILFSIKRFFKFLFYVFLPVKFVKYIIPRNPKKSLIKNVVSTKSSLRRKEPTIDAQNKYAQPYESKNLKEDSFNFDNQYNLPPLSLLKKSNEKTLNQKENDNKNIEYAKKLETILREYGVEGKINNFKTGPVITLFEFIPAAGIKTSKVVGLSEDIARAMSSISTRISFQPGKNSIAIEIPNNIRQNVYLGDLIVDDSFFDQDKNLTLALGKNIAGEKKYTDLEKMPHLLIAGTTGSGKSVGINSMILSLLFKFKPSECKLILVDPKMLELSIYEDIPHLMAPVVTDPNKAVYALRWVVKEMENRYRVMSSTNVKNIQSFNLKVESTLSQGKKLFREVQTGIDSETNKPIIEKKEIPLERMPFIVVIIDEMADLMMVAGKEVENLVQRLAQMARASGIHLITATQRPSVDVITGTIKANFPSRISFRVASRFDSRTILNEMGAEQLLGSGDMLFLENGSNLVRLHGGFVSEGEIEKVVNFIKSQSTNVVQRDITSENNEIKEGELNFNLQSKNVDELYDQAVALVIKQQKVSTSFVQRYLQIGYNRAARIVEQMEADGIISEQSNAGKRNVLKKKQ